MYHTFEIRVFASCKVGEESNNRKLHGSTPDLTRINWHCLYHRGSRTNQREPIDLGQEWVRRLIYSLFRCINALLSAYATGEPFTTVPPSNRGMIRFITRIFEIV